MSNGKNKINEELDQKLYNSAIGNMEEESMIDSSNLQIPNTIMDQDTSKMDVPEVKMSRQEQLLKEYNDLIAKGQEDVKEARKRERTAKLILGLGDNLATYLKARSQMNVKAPGVQITPGAGLSKLGSMFETAGDVKEDTRTRAQGLMNQLQDLKDKEQAALNRALQERRVDLEQKRYESSMTEKEKDRELKKELAKIKAQDKLEASEKKDLQKLQTPTLTEGQKTRDREFAKRLEEYEADAGTYKVNQEKIKDVINKLKTGDITTGYKSGVATKLGELVGYKTDVAEAQDTVRSAVQSMLRPILGGQFAAEEGERVIKTAFDSASSVDSNMKKLEDELKKIEAKRQVFEKKKSIFDKYGTLSPQNTEQKIIVGKQYSPSRDKTKLIYSDGTEEIIDGKQ